MDYIKENLDCIKQKISNAAKKSGRTYEDILLVGVTKTIGEDRIDKLIELGVNDLGENRVQELIKKYETVHGNPNWHLIGHLQTNKVKYVLGKTVLIHSVDSLKLMEEISKRAMNAVDVLIEINIAGENTKHGLRPDELEPFLCESSKYNNICIKGLMTVAPYTPNPENNRVFFRNMRKLLIDIQKKNIDNVNMQKLSMGMTNDYEVAIEEGANIVRIGTGIFGERL